MTEEDGEESEQNEVARAFEQPAENFLSRMKELADATFLSIHAIGSMEGTTRLTEVLHGKKEGAEKRIKHARELEDLANREAEQGFPNVLEQATIGIWTALEIAVDDFVVQWLVEYPSAIQDDRIRNIDIKFSLSEALTIDAMPASERIEHIITEVRRTLNVQRSSSPGRFKSLLTAVGLDVNFDPDMRRDLIKLWAIRNLYVHRGRRADNVFLSQYPGEEYTRGDLVQVSEALFMSFHKAARYFIADLVHAANERAGELLNEAHGLPNEGEQEG